MRVAFDDFLLDSERRELTRADRPIHLTPKAFDLLAYLVERRPKAIPQQQLFDSLWPGVFVETSSLHKLIHELRDALHDDERRIIRTAYGRGFSFAISAVRIDGAAPSSFELIVAGHRFPLQEGDNVVGREREAAVRLEYPSVSRRHARILVTGPRVSIEDLGSKNGTFVDGKRIHGLTPLSDGADVLVGKVQASLSMPPPLQSTETAVPGDLTPEHRGD